MNANSETGEKVENFSDLSKEITKYENNITLHPNFLFRGQADTEWSLEPSFTRLANRRKLTRKLALQLERETVNRFSICANMLIPLENTISLSLSRMKSPNGKGLDFLGWFVIMQHYSAPTRKLDWTTSPWVGLYFSCCEEEKSDGTLWIADFKKVDEYAKNKLKEACNNEFVSLITKPDTPDILVFSMAFNTNERIEAQQGRFSVCTNPLTDHKKIIEAAGGLSKIDIPKELKPVIMKELYKMNISAKTLFPGIDGLGKSIYEYCNLWDETSIIE